jgi:outer membrane immunogenic protein
MKHVTITALGVFGFATAFGQSAVAADLSTRAPVYKAVPGVPPAYSWSGCYFGGQVGGGWSDANWTNRVSEVPWADFGPGDGISYHGSGWIGGGQIDCNYQLDRQWVLGIEGTLAGAGIKGSRLDTVFGQRDDTYSTKITAQSRAGSDMPGTIGCSTAKADLRARGSTGRPSIPQV